MLLRQPYSGNGRIRVVHRLMDGGSIPPSSTNTYALTRGYAKKAAGRNPQPPEPNTAGQPLFQDPEVGWLLPDLYRSDPHR